MKKIALKITIILSAFFILAGVSYSYWTDEVDVYVNAGTAETELEIVGASVISENAQNVTLSSYKNRESIRILDLDDDSIKISIQIKNTGTIPVDVDSLKLYELNIINGDSSYRNDIKVKVQMYLKGNRVLKKNKTLSKLKNDTKIISMKPSKSVRLEPGQEATIYLTFSNIGEDDSEQDEQDEEQVKTKINFDINFGVIYSRFNK